MKTLHHKILSFSLVVLVFASCTSKAKLDRLSAECEKHVYINGISFSLVGFTRDEADTFFVREMNQAIRVDSFLVTGIKASFEKGDSVYSGRFPKKMDIRHSYQLYISGDYPHLLSDFSVGTWSDSRLVGKKHWCDLRLYSLDGVIHAYDYNLVIRKGK